MSPPAPVAVAAVDGGELELGGGLLAVVRPALDLVAPGGVVAVLSSSKTVREDLPSWCRAERHKYLGREAGEDGRDRHLIERGKHGVPQGIRETGIALGKKRSGELTSADMLSAVPMPPSADPHSGFAPRGARVEPGGPSYPFTLLERDHLAPPEIGQIYDLGTSQQWDAATDIAWGQIKPLPAELESAVGQLMTFLAENELSALYVPARFLPRIHPAYTEVAMVLAQQMNDEARHIDVFLKRARAAGGGLGISTVTTARSLLSLLVPEDFTEAEFLLAVLGEGTFLDLLRYIETHAPDEPTADIMKRARVDESRHVRFGLAHVRFALARDPTLFGRLEAAVKRRAEVLTDLRVPDPVQDALTVLAAKGTHPKDIAKGHEHYQELLQTMSENRVTRLLNAGFTREQAEILSGLHTSNFM